jgi:hypothetical protein
MQSTFMTYPSEHLWLVVGCLGVCSALRAKEATDICGNETFGKRTALSSGMVLCRKLQSERGGRRGSYLHGKGLLYRQTSTTSPSLLSYVLREGSILFTLYTS